MDRKGLLMPVFAVDSRKTPEVLFIELVPIPHSGQTSTNYSRRGKILDTNFLFVLFIALIFIEPEVNSKRIAGQNEKFLLNSSVYCLEIQPGQFWKWA